MIASMNSALLGILYWMLIFFLMALLTAFCGAGSVATVGAIVARILFFGLIVGGAISRVPVHKPWNTVPQ